MPYHQLYLKIRGYVQTKRHIVKKMKKSVCNEGGYLGLSARCSFTLKLYVMRAAFLLFHFTSASSEGRTQADHLISFFNGKVNEMTNYFKTADDADSQKKPKQTSNVSEKLDKGNCFLSHDLGEKWIFDKNCDDGKVIFRILCEEIN